MIHRTLIPALVLATAISCFAIADERETVTEIRGLISQKQLDEAAKLLSESRKDYPKSASLAGLGLTLAGAYAN